MVIRRTRPFIKEAYPNATIKGQPIHWPERRLKTIRYDLEATDGGIYDKIVNRIETLRLASYRLETYKKQGIRRDQFEEGREEALAGIFKSRYLKRFESSIEAFRISVRRALQFLETFESYILEGKVLDSASFQKATRYLAREDEEDDATPSSLSDQLDESREARQFIDTLPILEASLYDLKRLHNDLRRDVEALRSIWHDISTITADRDAKLARLKELLAGELKGQKVLLFTYYKDTARYLYHELSGDNPAAAAWQVEAGEPRIRRMDSRADARERARLVAEFAPRANHKPEIAGTDRDSIVQSSVEQVAVEEAPKQLDPIQQTIATILRGYINSPAVNRKDVIAAIQQLNQPLPGVYIKELRRAHESFTTNGLVTELLAAVQGISQATVELPATPSESKAPVRREDLKLVCFDYLWQ